MFTKSAIHARFPEQPAVGVRLPDNRDWEQYEDRLAQEGAIEARNPFWATKSVEQ